jgi:hypothetical protein
MLTSEEKVIENRARRAARRRGLELIKATRRPACWLLVDPDTARIASGLLLMTIDEIEVFLGLPARRPSLTELAAAIERDADPPPREREVSDPPQRWEPTPNQR